MGARPGCEPRTSPFSCHKSLRLIISFPLKFKLVLCFNLPTTYKVNFMTSIAAHIKTESDQIDILRLFTSGSTEDLRPQLASNSM